jgi:hypothetical protein
VRNGCEWCSVGIPIMALPSILADGTASLCMINGIEGGRWYPPKKENLVNSNMERNCNVQIILPIFLNIIGYLNEFASIGKVTINLCI